AVTPSGETVMTNDQERWQWLMEGIRRGDPQACEAFWADYGAKLQEIAEWNLAAWLRRRIGPEDVVQSVCCTFFRRLQKGEYQQLADGEGLLALLCAITLNKVRRKARYHQAAKRDARREVSAAGSPADNEAPLEVAARGPSPEEAVAFADQLERLIASLDPDERTIVQFM